MLAAFLLAGAEGSKARLMACDCKLLTFFRGLLRDVIGRAGGINALVATDQEGPFEEPGALVVQEVFVPTALHQFGNDHDNLSVGVFLGEFENVLNDGNDDEAIGRWKKNQLGRLDAGGAEGLLHVALPFRTQELGMFARLNVNADDFRGKT